MSATLSALVPWLAQLAPPVLSVLTAILLVVTTVAAIRAIQPASAATPTPTPALPAAPTWLARATDALGRLGRDLTDGLHAAGLGPPALAGTPVLAVIGAATGDVLGIIPGIGGRPPGPGVPTLTGTDGLLSYCPDGAVLTFPDGLLGSSGWQARWTALLRQLMAMRRGRPLDGVVIMLGVDEFVGANKLTYDMLLALGGYLRQAIQIAEQTGGWRLPIQLVLDHAETLDGFALTAAALPVASRQGPFGWAPPAGLGPSYGTGWVDTGVGALTAQVAAMQTRLLPPPESQVATFRQLPAALAALAPPLTQLLNAMLGPGPDQRDFMFRGFYLTGHVPAPESRSGVGAGDIFARCLFPDRFFPETDLVQPTGDTQARRTRQIRTVQGAIALAVLLGVVGLVLLWNRQPAVDAVQRMVTQVGQTLQQIQASGQTLTGTPAIEALLRQMTPVTVNHLETGLAPLSFVSGARGAPEAVIRSGYETVLLPAIQTRLTSAIPVLLGAPASAVPTDCAAGDATSADADRLKPFGAALGQYGTQVETYQTLSYHPDIARFGSLLTYTLGTSPPAGFSGDPGLYQGALRGAVGPALNASAITTTVDTIVQSQFARGVAGAYSGSPVARAVDTTVATAGVVEGDVSATQAVGQLDAALHALQSQANVLNVPWLADNVSDPRISAFLRQLGDLSASGSANAPVPVNQTLEPSLAKLADSCRAQTRDRLVAAKALTDLPVLNVSPILVRLNPDWLPVMTALDGFLALPLMTSAPLALPKGAVPANAPLLWDTQELQSAQAQAASYLTFVAQNLPASLPQSLVTQIQAVAGTRLAALATALVARARQRGAEQNASASPTSTAALHDAITRFADAAPVLTNLQGSLRQAGQASAAAQLDGIVFDQAVSLLRQVDGVLNAADPYQLADPTLSFWSGSPPLAAPAFGAASQAELTSSLPARRNYVAALSQDYAAPLVAYMQQSGALPTVASTALLSRWQLIATALNQAQSGATTSTVGKLEQFISTTMDQITLANCAQLTGGGPTGPDWFAEQLRGLQSAVARRCGGVTTHDASGEYGDLAGDFNRDLAGRFPFGPPAAPDAAPSDVKRFFNRYGSDLGTLGTGLASISSYASVGAPQFVAQLQAAQTALAPMLQDPSPDAPLTYDVAPTFRTNAGKDPGADQIIEAELQLGTQTLTTYSTTKSLAWTTGQPVVVRLQWALNAPNVPLAGNAGQPPAVQGLTATYRATGPWALLRMIALQRPDAAALAQLSDRQPETIEFVPNLGKNPAAVSGGETGLTSAQVFMRLALTGIVHIPQQPDKRVPVALPVFPQAAPVAGGS
jgi:type VI secretion system protein ImpL